MCRKRLQQPRVLGCLHVFCSGCLDRLLEDKDKDDAVGGDGDAAAEMAAKTSNKLAAAAAAAAASGTEPEQLSLVCPTCSQVGLL